MACGPTIPYALLIAGGLAAGCLAAREARQTAAPAATAPAQTTQPVSSAAEREGAVAPSLAERERLLAIGKELFTARCGSCHNAGGDKPLKSGPPLNRRMISAEDIARNVNARVKNATAEQRRAVILYMQSFLGEAARPR